MDFFNIIWIYLLILKLQNDSFFSKLLISNEIKERNKIKNNLTYFFRLISILDIFSIELNCFFKLKILSLLFVAIR